MRKTLSVVILVALFLVNGIDAAAASGTITKYLNADHGKATALMNYKFTAKLLGKDKADASTSLTKNKGGYRAAVRLEGCDSKGTIIDYVYVSDGTAAKTGEMSFKDVASFRSRHSIDEFDSNYNYVEVEADSIFKHE